MKTRVDCSEHHVYINFVTVEEPWPELGYKNMINCDIQVVQYKDSLLNKLERFCLACEAEGMENNSSLKKMKLERTLENGGMFWLLVDAGSDSVVGVCGVEKLSVEIDEWDSIDRENCFRVGFRHAVLREFRANVKSGLASSLVNNHILDKVFPLSFVWAMEKGARRLICTTNSPSSKAHSMDKMYQMDRVVRTFFLKNQYVRKLRENYLLYDHRQNLWEILPLRWLGAGGGILDPTEWKRWSEARGHIEQPERLYHSGEIQN